MLLFQIGAAVLLITACVFGLRALSRGAGPSGLNRYYWLMLGYAALTIAQALVADPALDWVLLGMQLVLVVALIVTVARLVRQQKARAR